MNLRALIQSRMQSPVFFSGVSEEQIQQDYKAIRQYILDHHSEAHDCVVIKRKRDHHYFLMMLACMEVGVTYIPMKHDFPEDRVMQIKEDSNFTLLVDDEKLKEILSYTGSLKTTLPEVSSEKDVYVIFTSGSTGRPKGVLIKRSSLENFLTFIDEKFSKVTSVDRLLQMTEFSFDLSVMDIGLFLTKNVAMYFSNFENNIFKMGFEIETHRITVINTVPNNLNMFLSDMIAERMDYRCLRTLNIGGARFSHGLYEKCRHYFSLDVDVYNFYGPTEATVYSHVHKITYDPNMDLNGCTVSIGKPIQGNKASIVIDGQSTLANVPGELYIGGVQVMRGYINNPELTNRALVSFQRETYYRSGDLAFMDEKGDFFITGRADDTIKYRGYRINLLDIDSYITRIPYIQDSVTIAIPNENTENQTLSFLILKEKKTAKELKADLGALLLDYQIPEKFIFVDRYPTNVSGKVCRKTLKEQYLESFNKVAS